MSIIEHITNCFMLNFLGNIKNIKIANVSYYNIGAYLDISETYELTYKEYINYVEKCYDIKSDNNNIYGLITLNIKCKTGYIFCITEKEKKYLAKQSIYLYNNINSFIINSDTKYKIYKITNNNINIYLSSQQIDICIYYKTSII